MVAHKILLSAPVPIGPFISGEVALVFGMGLDLGGLGMGQGLDNNCYIGAILIASLVNI